MSWYINIVGKPEAVAKKLKQYLAEPDNLRPDSSEKKVKTLAVECAIAVAEAAQEGQQAIRADLNGHAWDKNQTFNITMKTIGLYVE
jgi:hypothetical protein